MAIIDDLPGVKTEITVDGITLKEFEEHEEEQDDELERTITRYVEATSDALFAIDIQLLPSFVFRGDAISFKIYADGEPVDHFRINKSDRTRKRRSEGPKSGGGRSKYCFSGLETVSDGHVKNGERVVVKDLGTIVVECVHKRVTSKVVTVKQNSAATASPSSPRSEVVETGDPGIVSEKALKGRTISHSIKFASVGPPPAPIISKKPSKSKAASIANSKALTRTKTTSSELPGEPSPAATFIFNYRSLAALKSMLIIPRTPTPPPLEERDITTLSIDELRELQKRAQDFRKQQEAQVKVKRENTEDIPQPRKKACARAGDTQLEIDDSGNIREGDTTTLAAVAEKVVIEIDSD